MIAARILDHDEVLRKLDNAFGDLAPLPAPDKRWDLLCGDYPRACQHIRIGRVQLAGRACVSCNTCDHSWFEYSIVLEEA